MGCLVRHGPPDDRTQWKWTAGYRQSDGIGYPHRLRDLNRMTSGWQNGAISIAIAAPSGPEDCLCSASGTAATPCRDIGEQPSKCGRKAGRPLAVVRQRHQPPWMATPQKGPARRAAIIGLKPPQPSQNWPADTTTRRRAWIISARSSARLQKQGIATAGSSDYLQLWRRNTGPEEPQTESRKWRKREPQQSYTAGRAGYLVILLCQLNRE